MLTRSQLPLHPNSISALKKFSALFHEENFFEEIELPLSPNVSFNFYIASRGSFLWKTDAF